MYARPSLDQLFASIQYASNPIGMRMRAAYYLRQIHGEEKKKEETDAQTNNTAGRIIEAIGQALCDSAHGCLMRHEFAYVLGQMRDARACGVLENVLSDESQDVMVRHECAEALGAIGSESSLECLKNQLQSDKIEIYETCRIAIDFLEWNLLRKEEQENIEQPMACACMLSPYSSVDPAPPHPAHAKLSILEITSILLDASLPLFERYRAMFSLRNIGTDESALALGKALVEDESSALFRHEIAYVLGQMQKGVTLDSLATSLRREGEHAMVRHEAAEAIGAIEEKWSECEVLLEEFSNDHDIVVRESCLVALDAADYWGHSSGGCIPHNTGGGNGDVDSNEEEKKEFNVTVETTNFHQLKNDHVENIIMKEKQPSLMNHFNTLIS